MKKWEAATMVSLDLTNTEHNWIGIYRDGGYIGDGEISGHLSWTKPEENQPSSSVTTPAETEEAFS